MVDLGLVAVVVDMVQVLHPRLLSSHPWGPHDYAFASTEREGNFELKSLLFA